MTNSSSTEDEFVDLYCRNRPYKANTLPEKKKAPVFDQFLILMLIMTILEQWSLSTTMPVGVIVVIYFAIFLGV